MTFNEEKWCMKAYIKKDLYEMRPDNWSECIEIAKDRTNREGRTVKTYYWFRTLTDFIDTLINTHPDARWYYEMIPGDRLAAMYFDVEWYDHCGTFADGISVVRELIEKFAEFIFSFQSEVAGCHVPNSTDWMILRAKEGIIASGKLKFSYHIVCRPGWLAKSAQDRQQIFHCFSDYLESINSPLCNLPDAHDGTNSPLDPSVYSQWQALRTIWSRKLGSSRELVPVDLNNAPLVPSASETARYFVTFATGEERVFDTSILPERVQSAKKRSHPCGGLKTQQLTYVTDLMDHLITEEATSVTMLENDRSIEFYLRCIPNLGVGQPWQVYFAVAAATQRSRGTADTFRIWASQSVKFNETDFLHLWRALSDSARPVGYNIGTLRKMAKHCAPWAFTGTNMDFHTRLPLKLYESQYMQPLPTEMKTLIAQSPMGSGKTFSMIQFITELTPKRVLLLSSRKTYAENATSDLNVRLPPEFKFSNYTQIDGPLEKISYLTIQMESLYRLEKAEPYDILFIDEVEGCLKQFSSPTMLSARQRLLNNFLVFEKIYKTAKRKVLMDAFLSQRTIDFVETHIPSRHEQENEPEKFVNEGALVMVNQNVPRRRSAIQYANYKRWEEELEIQIHAGKRVVVFWGSKAKGDVFEKRLKSQNPDVNIKFYHSASDDILDADLSNVRDSWKDVQVLMYTAKITVGVNFDTEGVFDLIFVYGSSGACGAREVIQASMRVRHLREDIMHYHVSGGHHRSGTTPTMENLQNSLAKKRQYLDDIALVASTSQNGTRNDIYNHQILQMLDWGHEKEWMIRLHLQNLLEEEQSRCKFGKVFRDFLKRAGYTCHFDCSIILDRSNEQRCGTPYSDIPVITAKQLNVLLNGSNGSPKLLTATEKLVVKKHYFLRLFEKAPEAGLETLWKFWENSQYRERLENMKMEQVSTPRHVYVEKMQKVRLKSFIPKVVLQYNGLRRLLNVLGLRDSLDTESVVSSTVIENLPETLKDLEEVLTYTFEAEPRQKARESKRSNKRQALELVNKVLTTWSNSRLVACPETRKQKRIGGKKYSTFDYQLINKFELELSDACGHPYQIKHIFSESDISFLPKLGTQT